MKMAGMAGMISPKELLEAAKEMMLQGKEPSTQTDWIKVINFFSVNLVPDKEFQMACIKILVNILDIPVDNRTVDIIVDYQLQNRQEKAKQERFLQYHRTRQAEEVAMEEKKKGGKEEKENG